MDVVGGRVVRILVGKAVPQVGPDELAQAERSADVGLVDLVEVEPVREPDRLVAAGEGGGEPGGDEADPWLSISWLPRQPSQGRRRPGAGKGRSARASRPGR